MSFFGQRTTFGTPNTPVNPASSSKNCTMFEKLSKDAKAPTPAFGAPATTTGAPSLANSFGAPNISGGLFPIFGSAALTAAPKFGVTKGPNIGLGVPVTNALPTYFGANAQPNSTASSFFGGTTTITNAPKSFRGFDAATDTQFFGGFTGFGRFGSNFNNPAGEPSQPSQPSLSAANITSDQALEQALFNVNIFGDERDVCIAKWNYLMALWGYGQAFYSLNATPANVTPHNHFCRFKTVAYSVMPGEDNKLGFVALNFNKLQPEVEPHRQEIIKAIACIFGDRPNLTINIQSINEIKGKKCQVVIYVEEPHLQSPHMNRRHLATEVARYLNLPNVKPLLEKIHVNEVIALVTPDDSQLRMYLDMPPKGINPEIWFKSIRENPDPKRFIPVPLIGIDDLKWFRDCQESLIGKRALFLNKIEKGLAGLAQKIEKTTRRISQQQRQFAALSQRLVTTVFTKHCKIKSGLPLTPEEDAIGQRLQHIMSYLKRPINFEIRVRDLLAQMRKLQNRTCGCSTFPLIKINEQEIKLFLSLQQENIEKLTQKLSDDMKTLQDMRVSLLETKRR